MEQDEQQTRADGGSGPRRVGVYDRPKKADLPVRKIAIGVGMAIAAVSAALYFLF